MHDNADMIKALECLIAEMKAGRLNVIGMKSSAPVREKNVVPFQDFKEFEHTGDLYIKIHFAFQRIAKDHRIVREEWGVL